MCGAAALDGGTLRVNPRSGWKAFEVISVGNNPSDDGFDWSMPGTFDGIGAFLATPATLRLQINPETSDATISEVNLNLSNFQTALANTINTGSTGGGSFVISAQQAYDRWSNNGGISFTNTTSVANTSFRQFCSGQSYVPNTFGAGRGFVDDVYITGEETTNGRLFALDLDNRDFYQLSGATGSAGGGGIGGMPADAWENAALIDTGETDHIALLLSPDGGSEDMQIFIGEKGKDTNGNASSDFLARNGLAYGSYYYLNDSLPDNGGTSTNGFFDATSSGALNSSKLEDIDTSPGNPTQVVLGDQTSGLFTFDFDLDFGGGSFNAAGSGFSITKIHDHIDNVDNAFGDADNVDWSAPTVLHGTAYPEGLIFVNEDTGTGNGEIWVTEPDGSGLTRIGDTTGISGATESTGILDISELVGYNPGSIVLTNNQGNNSSLSVLINPDATLAELDPTADFDDNGNVDGIDFLSWQRGFGKSDPQVVDGDANRDGAVDGDDLTIWSSQFGQAASALSNTFAVLEPSCVCLALLAGWLASLAPHQRYRSTCTSVKRLLLTRPMKKGHNR